MPVLEFFPVQVKNICGFPSRNAVPAVGQDYATNVPEHGCNFRQGGGPRILKHGGKARQIRLGQPALPRIRAKACITTSENSFKPFSEPSDRCRRIVGFPRPSRV